MVIGGWYLQTLVYDPIHMKATRSKPLVLRKQPCGIALISPPGRPLKAESEASEQELSDWTL